MKQPLRLAIGCRSNVVQRGPDLTSISPTHLPPTTSKRSWYRLGKRYWIFDPFGIHDDFFDLEGHSLAATRVVSRVIKEFQMEIPLQSLFQSSTVAEMAVMIIKHQAKKLGKADLNRLLAQLESLSNEDADRLLKGESE